METNGARIGRLTILTLVLLRVAAGWHFYREGSAKLSYDERASQFEVVFSAEGFLRQAKGPLAPYFHAMIGSDHDWEELLSHPVETTPKSSVELHDWVTNYTNRQAAAAKAKQPALTEFPPQFADWGNQISSDWEAILKKVTSLGMLSEAQSEDAAEAYLKYKQRLSDYLVDEAGGIELYQHELWRLKNLKSAPEAGRVPFKDQRIAEKEAEVASIPQPWLAQVRQLETGLRNELQKIAMSVEPPTAEGAAELRAAASDPLQERLASVNLAVTILTLGVGICLMAGLFTRLAALAGAAFLASVVLTQPPWIAGTAPTYYQLVECAALLVLMATGAGRWLGLDAIPRALWQLCCGGCKS